jgi:hypothetical protein
MPTMHTWTKPEHLLSENRKCGASIDLPIQGHCTPTKHCNKDCYAHIGFQAFPNAKRKQTFISQYLTGPDISQLIKECRAHPSIRLNGSGDLNPSHLLNVIRLAKALPNVMFWGMTRKPPIARYLNGKAPNLKMLLSIDASTPESVWKTYKGPLCWGPRHAEDNIPDDPRIITVFPKHVTGKVKDIPHHPKDCPAVRHTVDGCLSCNRCSNW